MKKRCKELDQLHLYEHDSQKVKKYGGFHAACLAMHRKGSKVASIIIRTGSIHYSVRMALFNLGMFKKKPINKKRVTDKDAETIGKLYSEGKSQVEIGEAMERPQGSIRYVLIKLGLIKPGGIVHVFHVRKTKQCASCGEIIVHFRDMCNWCRGKNATQIHETDNTVS